MIHLTIKRIAKRPEYTVGRLYVEGEYLCDTLEDTVRDLGKDGSGKVYGKTSIPEGLYRIILSRSPRFKRLLPEILGVPFFTGVRIHALNTAEESEGCIGVGENKEVGKVLNSRYWENKLMEKLKCYSHITLEIT